MTTAVEQPPARRRDRFMKNVLWSWLGVATSIITGFWLSPFIFRKLGDEAFGIWTLVFAFLEYYWLLDLGFRSATLKYAAHYRATGEDDKVNEVINTGLAYSIAIAVLMLFATFTLSGYANRFFLISDEYLNVFTVLVAMVGSGWAVGSIFNLFSAAVEGYQRFDVTSRIWISTIALRTVGLVAVLWLGYRMKAMAAVVLATLAFGYLLNYITLRRVFPSLRFSMSSMRLSMFRQMLAYGVHTSVATVGGQVLNQGAPLLLGHFLPTAFVGYFAQPVRLLRYSVDMVCKVGFVTGASAAEMAAKGEYSAVYDMGLYVNRYCLALFSPLALALCLYGQEFMRLWMSPAFALQSAPIIPVIAVCTTLGIAGQFNSSSILYGLGKHRGYAYSLLVEAILGMIAMYFAIPHYGIMGAAWITSVLMVLNRGLFTSWLFCAAVDRHFGRYLEGIYAGPILVALPVFVGAWWIKLHWLPGRTWAEVLTGMGLLAILYYGLAFFVCLKKEHQSLSWRWVQARLHAGRAA
jgi:O-antigen/teichoic acid export membrane protein